MRQGKFFTTMVDTLTGGDSNTRSLPFTRAARTLVLVVSLVSLVYPQTPNSLTTIILVRHAEKDTGDLDPSLTNAGRARAGALAQVLDSTNITAIYVTQYVRTQQTVQVVASRHNLTPRVFPIDLSKKRYGAALAGEILRNNPGKTVLVANHSTVIPFILEALGIAAPDGGQPSAYDDLFIVTRDSIGSVSMVRLKYGGPPQ